LAKLSDDTFAKSKFSREWGKTMCLPEAGSKSYILIENYCELCVEKT